MIKQIMDNAIAEGTEALVNDQGGLAPINPFQQPPETTEEDIDFVSDTFTNNSMRDIFSEEREIFRGIYQEILSDMKGRGFDTSDKLEVTEDHLDELIEALYGEE